MTAKHTENLLCPVTSEDRLEKSKDLGRYISERDRVEADKKDCTQRLNAEIKALDKKIREVGCVVRTGQEYQAVECESRPDLDKRIMRIIRLDTHDEVRSRPLTANELEVARQTKLDLQPPSGGKSEKSWVDAIKGMVPSGYTVERPSVRRYKVLDAKMKVVAKATSMTALKTALEALRGGKSA